MIIKITNKLKLNLPIERERALKATLVAVAVLLALSLVMGITCAVLFFETDRFTVEAGSAVTAEMLTGDSDAYFGEDFDHGCVNRVGVYYFTVFSGGKERQIRLEVVDTKAPEIEVRRIKWPVGRARAPIPEDFIGSVTEASEFSGYFVEELPEFQKMGEYRARVRFVDESGNKTEIFDVYLDLVSDGEQPVVELAVSGITAEIGYDPTVAERSIYEGIATVKDNCAGDTRIEIDDSEVDYNKKGRYTAYVYGYDMIGNRSDKVAVTVEIVDTD